jgi:hypothetical protein
MTLTRRLIAISLAIILLNGTTALACGPFTLEAIFTYTVHPEIPFEQFAAGRIGVVQPSYARSYLYTAYRHLSGLNFTASEQKALVDLWHERLGIGPNEDEASAPSSAVWLESRKKVPGVRDRSEIDVYRAREKPNEYESFVNCNHDAFETAAKTLAERIVEYKSDSAALLKWISAQDQVFSNCSSGSFIPDPLPADARLLERQDRAYQIAAAHFYSTNFDEAKKRFEEIAADDNSRWHFMSAYMVARTLIRKASLGAPEQKQESLQAAQSQLAKILAVKSFANLHASATRLRNLIRLRLNPNERVHELARILTDKKQNDNLKQDLWDYTTLLDQNLETDEKKAAAKLKDEDLSDWITTIQLLDAGGLDHALERWQTTHNDAWLIAVLSKIDGQHSKTAELIAQAMNVKVSAAAFPSARFHAARLLIESGKHNEARTLLDQLLKSNRDQFDQSSLNLLISQRMRLATTLDDFLVYVPREPAAYSWNDDGRELPVADPISAEVDDAKFKTRFDYDAGEAFNNRMPLAVLKQAVLSRRLPAPLRTDLAQAVWLRAVLLGDLKTADEVVPTLRELVPELSPLLDDYMKATTPQAKKFAAIYAWLKSPGLEPVVDVGVGRTTRSIQEQDSYRDNWWCRAAFPPPADQDDSKADAPTSFTARNTQPLLFVSATEKAAAEREWNALSASGAAPNYLAREVIQAANRMPDDPRMAEALHLAVKSTRYGCTDKDTARWSKAAFDVLHRKYPNTTWAKKTPYWFKE